MAPSHIHSGKGAWLKTFYRRSIPVPLIAFIGTALTDWVYSNSGNFMWATWSAWLLLFGLVGCGVSAMALALGARDRSGLRGGWLAVFLFVALFVIEFVNFMIHMRDGWTAVMPSGLPLSLIGAALALVAAWLSREVRA